MSNPFDGFRNHPDVIAQLGAPGGEEARTAASASGKASRDRGELAEALVASELRRRGHRMVERVHTPWKVIWKNGQPARAFTVEKVSGDWRGVEPDTGRSVLVEVKARSAPLEHSALASHQVRALTTHAELGGLSILAWVDVDNARRPITLLEWPVAGFRNGTSLSHLDVEQLDGGVL